MFRSFILSHIQYSSMILMFAPNKKDQLERILTASLLLLLNLPSVMTMALNNFVINYRKLQHFEHEIPVYGKDLMT